jgi:hypothetical protein
MKNLLIVFVALFLFTIDPRIGFAICAKGVFTDGNIRNIYTVNQEHLEFPKSRFEELSPTTTDSVLTIYISCQQDINLIAQLMNSGRLKSIAKEFDASRVIIMVKPLFNSGTPAKTEILMPPDKNPERPYYVVNQGTTTNARVFHNSKHPVADTARLLMMSLNQYDFAKVKLRSLINFEISEVTYGGEGTALNLVIQLGFSFSIDFPKEDYWVKTYQINNSRQNAIYKVLAALRVMRKDKLVFVDQRLNGYESYPPEKQNLDLPTGIMSLDSYNKTWGKMALVVAKSAVRLSELEGAQLDSSLVEILPGLESLGYTYDSESQKWTLKK